MNRNPHFCRFDFSSIPANSVDSTAMTRHGQVSWPRFLSHYILKLSFVHFDTYFGKLPSCNSFNLSLGLKQN